MDEEPKPAKPIIFDGLDTNAIRNIAVHTHGAASPSGMDVYAWRILFSSLKFASIICVSHLLLPSVCCHIAITSVNPKALS